MPRSRRRRARGAPRVARRRAAVHTRDGAAKLSAFVKCLLFRVLCVCVVVFIYCGGCSGPERSRRNEIPCASLSQNTVHTHVRRRAPVCWRPCQKISGLWRRWEALHQAAIALSLSHARAGEVRGGLTRRPPPPAPPRPRRRPWRPSPPSPAAPSPPCAWRTPGAGSVGQGGGHAAGMGSAGEQHTAGKGG